MSENTAVQFAGNARIHVGFGVGNVAKSVAFYTELLGQAPVKQQAGYAKFEPEEPSVNLSLYEVSGMSFELSRNHYGIQVKSTEAVHAAAGRLRAAGIVVREELETSCCYAFQDKIWVVDPDGHRWEVFVVTGANAPNLASEQTACCADATEECCQTTP